MHNILVIFPIIFLKLKFLKAYYSVRNIIKIKDFYIKEKQISYNRNLILGFSTPFSFLIEKRKKCFTKPLYPLLTIIIYFFHYEENFYNLLESIQLQTYENIEIMICNNSYLNENFEIIKEYQKNDNRLKIKNCIFSNFKGKFLLTLEPNDMLLKKDSLESITSLKNYESNFFYISTKNYNYLRGKRKINETSCKNILNYINSGNLLINFSRNASLIEVYKEANLCLQLENKKKYILPIFNQKNEFCKKKCYKTLFFLSKNRNYRGFKNINDLIISNIDKLLTYDNIYYPPMENEYFQSLGFQSNNNILSISSFNGYHSKQKLLSEIENKQKINKYKKFNFYIDEKPFIDKKIFYRIYKKHYKFKPKSFNFMTETYFFPEQKKIIEKKFKDYSIDLNDLWLIKPTKANYAKGIKIFESLQDLSGELIITKYISNPLLIKGKKMNYRLFVLISGVNPLRIYIHKEGFVSICFFNYYLSLNSIKNKLAHISNIYMSPTINNPNNKTDKINMTVFTIDQFKKILFIRGENFNLLYEKIKNVITKSIIIGQNEYYRDIKRIELRDNNFFRLLGFDILIDNNMKPWLIEGELTPGMLINNNIHKTFIDKILADMLNIIGFIPIDHKTQASLEPAKIKYKNIAYEDYNMAICELQRPRGDFELTFPSKTVLKKLQKSNKVNISKNKKLL